MFKYFTYENFDFKGKVVGIRVDINSPIIKGKVAPNERISASARSIKDLSDMGAKVVVLAHQGRKGKDDCVSLLEHSKLLEKELKRKVDFIPEIYSKKVESRVSSMKEGDILVLENLRFSDDEAEPKKKGNVILKLELLFDFYVFDAFSVSHREQASVVGFTKIPVVAGRLMQKELSGLNEIEETRSPHVFVFGGAKPDDLIVLMESALRDEVVDLVLLTGVIGEVGLYLKGYYLGKKIAFFEEHGFLECRKKLLDLMNKYSNRIVLPKDLAFDVKGKRVEIEVKDLEKRKDVVDNYLSQDVGSKTVDYYSILMKGVGSIYFKGPAGNFELDRFEVGTKGVIKGIIESGAFSFMGGGHSVTAVKNLGFLDKFSYVSLAGGALVKFLSGKFLPGVVRLEESHEKFEKVFEDFVVVGSNTIDINLAVPRMFNEVHLGEKIKIDDDFKTSVGGGGINVSLCLSRLGGKVGYLGKLSYESIDRIKEVLDKNKISLVKSKVSKMPASKSVLIDLMDGDRVIFTFRGQNSSFAESDFNVEDFRSNYYYFNSLTRTGFSTLLDLAKKVRKRNSRAMICYNPSAYLIGNEPKLKNLLKQVDVLVVNYEEAQGIVGEGSVSECLRKMRKIIRKFAVITDGANGSYVYDGDKEYFMPSCKPKRIVDSTGAGDAYAGTFFYFYAKGYGVRRAMRYAAVNASSVLSKKGAQDGLMYYADFEGLN